MSTKSQALQTVRDYIVANPNVSRNNNFSELRSKLILSYPNLTIADGYDIDKLIYNTDKERFWLMDYDCPKVGDIVKNHLVLETGIFTFTAKQIVPETETDSDPDTESQFATEVEVDNLIKQIRTMIRHNPSITLDKLREFSRTFDIVKKSKITFNQAVHVDVEILGVSDHCYWSLAYNHPKVGDMVEGDIVDSVGIFTFGVRQFDFVSEIKYKRQRSDANDFDVEYDVDFENDDHIAIRYQRTRSDANDFDVEYDVDSDNVDDVDSMS